MDNKELKHYGILGMRWGVRRTEAQLRRARGPRRVTKEQYEAEKEKAIKSGDAAKVRAWKDKLSNKELQDAINRVDLNKRLSEAEGKDIKSGLDKAENVVNKIGRVTSMGNTLLNVYGLVAKVNNTFNEKQLPSIDGINYKKKQEERDKKEERENAKEARESAKEAREKKQSDDELNINKLISEGNYQKVLDNYGSYDPKAIENVKKAIEMRSEFERKVKPQEEEKKEKK